MMGKDCERLLTEIIDIHEELHNSLQQLMGNIKYPMEVERFTVNHRQGTTEIFDLVEAKNVIPSSFFDPVVAAKERMMKDFDNMDFLKNDLYTDTSSFNNSNGSPWKEISKLKESIETIEELVKSVSVRYSSRAFVIMNLINAAISRSLDAKYSIILYHDYVQRGYDQEFNGRNPSVVHKAGIGKSSIGNLDQPYGENVNIKQPSIDPF